MLKITTFNLSFLLLFAANLGFGQNQECLPDNRTFPENNPLQTINDFGLTGAFTSNENKSCLPTGDEETFTFQVDCSENPSVTFTVEGGLELVSQSGNQVIVKPIADNSGITPRFDKGRIIADYTCSYDTTVQVPVPCLEDSTADYTYTITKEGRSYVDIYQEFEWSEPIVGPVCVTEGERVTYSIFDYVSGTSNSGIGIDDYKWCYPDGWTLRYFSADHSSITLDATSINPGQDVITVQVGRCNAKDTSKIIGQLLPAPDSVLTLCLNGTATNLDVPLTANPNITYTWDITADGNGYSFVSGNENTQGTITISVGSNNEGFILLTSSATPGNGIYCDEATRTDTIYYTRSATNPAITGPSCAVEGETYTFSVNLAEPISWTFPQGYTITSANPNGAEVTVTTDNSVVAGNVTAVSNHPTCGGGQTSLYVTAGPGKPEITGPVCINTNSNYVYSASASNADNYQWTFPSGFSPSTSQGNNLNVYTGNSTGGTIEVYAIRNGCPNSEVATLEVNPVPGNLTYINSDQSCLNKGLADTLTLSTDCGSSEYEWTLPGGWSFSGNDNTCSITVITDGTGGTVSVQAVSDSCGSGLAVSRTFTADGVGQDASIHHNSSSGTGVILETLVYGAIYQWYQDGVALAGEDNRTLDLPSGGSTNHDYCVDVKYSGTCTTRACDTSSFEPFARIVIESLEDNEANLVKISPNPAEDFVQLNAASKLSGTQYSIVSMNGNEMYKGKFKASGSKVNVSNWTSGTYLVKYTVNGKIQSIKINVQK